MWGLFALQVWVCQVPSAGPAGVLLVYLCWSCCISAWNLCAGHIGSLQGVCAGQDWSQPGVFALVSVGVSLKSLCWPDFESAGSICVGNVDGLPRVCILVRMGINL